MLQSPNWQKELEEYCARFDVPIEYLAATLSDPKVVPMIRGKAFEYSAVLALRRHLPATEWRVEKPLSNATSKNKDIDVKVTHIPSNKIVRVECKLAANKGFRRTAAKQKPPAPGFSTIKVKCMRSRTLGPEKVKDNAPKLGVTEKALTDHADNYRPADFDVVLTSIGNAFYRTNDAGEYEFTPSADELAFLEMLNPGHENHRVGAFEKLYLVKASDLYVGNPNYPVRCVRQKCKKDGHDADCGFVPNYPLIYFPENSLEPVNGWVSVNNCSDLFNRFITQPLPEEARTILAEQLADELPDHSSGN